MNPTKLLYISQIIRLIFTTYILYFNNTNLYIKIIFFMLSDSLDCGIPKKIFTNWIDCKSNTYQKSDKITDMISYFIFLLYLKNNSNFNNQQIKIIQLLFFYRLIGFILFIKFNNRKNLFYFPNFFLEFSLIFSIINQFNLQKYNNILYIITILFKLFQEYFLHFKKL